MKLTSPKNWNLRCTARSQWSQRTNVVEVGTKSVTIQLRLIADMRQATILLIMWPHFEFLSTKLVFSHTDK